MKPQIDISVVIPVYNNEESLSELLDRIHKALTPSYSYEVILIDDGSSDNSWKKITELKAQYSKTLKGIKLRKNYGQHNAIISGFTLANGDVTITMDDDLQHPPEEIIKLVETQKASEADLVYGLPINKKHSNAKKMGSYFVRRSSKYFADNTTGEGSSFRLIKKEIVEKINSNYINNYVFIDEIIHWYTSNISFVNVEHHNRKHGTSSYSFLKLTKIFLDVFINYTANPLKVMIYGGLTVSIVTFLFGIKFILRKMVSDVPLGYTSLIVSILFSTSIIMFCLGIIGKYVFNLYQQQSGKPLYHIQKII